jgi:lipoprotein-anchoring transpeptidase ErfK/SrfK
MKLQALLLSVLISTAASAAAAPCADPLAMQVFLDRQGFSPGVIDGKLGGNTARAATVYRQAKGMTASDPKSCDDLVADRPSTTTYQLTTEDAAGPFEPMPAEISQQVGRKELGYQSLLEKIAERFHATPALIQQLNPGAPIEAGATITVPDVEPFYDLTKPARADATGVSVEVTREGTLVARKADQIVFYAPVSSGSAHDPLPAGEWKVTGVSWRPPFHYNPALFWDAESTDQKALVAPGPNNPVGVVWIDINVKHYGLHGTPEPSKIGYTQSHGCVRMTNWDAVKLAALVAPGTPVTFK